MIISKEKYWKEVRKEEFKDNLFRIYLDETRLQSNQGNDIMISERLADEIVREWSVDGKIDSIKNSFFTKFCFSATDCTEEERAAVLDRLVEYGNCDPICYIASEPAKLNLKQEKLYNQMKQMALAVMNDKMTTTATTMTQLMRLQQITCGHFKADDGSVQEIKNNRIDELMDVLNEIHGKVVIWAHWRNDIATIVKHVKKTFGDKSYVTYYGDTSTDDRQKAIKQIQDPESEVRFIIGTPQTGGYGITLTEADTMVYYSNGYDLEKRT